MIRKRITFTGQVQGVGFRWRARQAAQLYNCTGWCRNDWDGSVTMEIQGPLPMDATCTPSITTDADDTRCIHAFIRTRRYQQRGGGGGGGGGTPYTAGEHTTGAGYTVGATYVPGYVTGVPYEE